MELQMEERIFTLAEANSLLPQLRSILEQVSAVWSRIKILNPEIQKARDNASFDGFSADGVQYVECITRLTFSVRQIQKMGVLLKDVDQGLCDFPYMKRGRLVYLCWHLGEDRIEYWHDVDAGFAGREPLDKHDQ